MPVRVCSACREEVADRDWRDHQAQHRRDRRNERSPDWSKTRAKVLARDGGRCTICGSTENVVVHHVNGDPTDDRLENLSTRCPEHHDGVGAKDGPPPWWAKDLQRPVKAAPQRRPPVGPTRLAILAYGLGIAAAALLVPPPSG